MFLPSQALQFSTPKMTGRRCDVGKFLSLGADQADPNTCKPPPSSSRVQGTRTKTVGGFKPAASIDETAAQEAAAGATADTPRVRGRAANARAIFRGAPDPRHGARKFAPWPATRGLVPPSGRAAAQGRV